ncbi:MAG: flagellar hook assembly protein FlgD [Alphaproteobacteria bacterium]|nr:flagellar hook assembly protein FlgD [Alphaproteobacteria bacterium]
MEIGGLGETLTAVRGEAASGGAASSSQSTSSLASVDYEMFLKLLMAQMENQDPLNPTDSTEYVAQLATFSQVEQSIQANAKLERMLTSLQVAQSESLVGSTVTSADGLVSGLVEAVEITGEGLVALLGSGERVTIAEGVRIS